MYGHLSLRPFPEAIQEFAEHCRDRLSLGHFLKQASLPALQAAVRTFRRYPKLAAAFDRWHGMSVLRDAIDQARSRLDMQSIIDVPDTRVRPGDSILQEKKAAPLVVRKLRVITWESSSGAPMGLSEEEQSRLFRDSVLIQDRRDPDPAADEVSIPLQVQVEQRLRNPDRTGLYQVLQADGSFARCLVVVSPLSTIPRPGWSLVVRLSEGHPAAAIQTKNVWVTDEEEENGSTEEAWRNWVASLPRARDLSMEDRRKGLGCVLVGPSRSGAWPVQLAMSLGDGVFQAGRLGEYALDTDPGQLGPDPDYQKYRGMDQGARPWSSVLTLSVRGRAGSAYRQTHDALTVPADAGVLWIAQRVRRSSRDEDVLPDVQLDPEAAVLRLGSPVDAWMGIHRKTASLQVFSQGARYQINGRTLPWAEALVHLVRDHGLTEAAGRQILKTADAKAKTGGSFSCRVKYASPFLREEAPDSPAFPDTMLAGSNPMAADVPSQEMYARDILIPELAAAAADRSGYIVRPDSDEPLPDVASVAQAAATGQKEIFDASVIGSMLKAVRDDSLIDQYLPDLVSGTDRLGRLLFQFYWHRDKFADRYGKQDLADLEDSLRSAFEMLGDVVIFLKQKTIQPYPEEDTTTLELSSTEPT